MGNVKKVVGYIRVSTQAQAEEGYSLQSQRTVIQKECEHKDWKLTEIFSDE